MTEAMWKYADADRMRRFITIQDFQFQAVMRAELAEMASERGLKLKSRERDILVIESSAVPLTDPPRIIRDVCDKHGVTRGELLGGQRQRRIVHARDEAAYRLKRETTLSLPLIGRKLGGKDHSTVILAIRRHEARLAGTVYRRPIKARGS